MRHARAVTVCLAAAAVVGAVVPASAKAVKPPAPITVYPQTTSCPGGSTPATYELETFAGANSNDCFSVSAGTGGVGRSDEDYIGAKPTHVRLAKAGAITGNIAIMGSTFPAETVNAVAVVGITVTLTINGVEVGTATKQGAATPTADFTVPINFAIPKSLRGKQIKAIDLDVAYDVAGGFPFVDESKSSLRIPRS